LTAWSRRQGFVSEGRRALLPRLWFNFGHAHQGFTLGAISGRLLADMIDGDVPVVDPVPYAAARLL